MIRALGILAAVVALAVTAAPVGSAHNVVVGGLIFDDGAGPAAAGLTRAAPPKAPSGIHWVSIGGGKDRGWFHGTAGDGEKFVRRGAAKVAPVAAARTSNAKFISRDGQFQG